MTKIVMLVGLLVLLATGPASGACRKSHGVLVCSGTATTSTTTSTTTPSTAACVCETTTTTTIPCDPCVAGTNTACGTPCINAVCQQDPSCCSYWGALCVSEAELVCGMACP